MHLLARNSEFKNPNHKVLNLNLSWAVTTAQLSLDNQKKQIDFDALQWTPPGLINGQKVIVRLCQKALIDGGSNQNSV